MARRFFFLLSMILLGAVFRYHPVAAAYDPLSHPNNRMGIHIFDPSEADRAAEFANGKNGDWGYVTVPIRANDRDLETWSKFLEKCRRLHIIPILRIASFPVDPDGAGARAHWMAPNEYDLVDFANFLDELPWPTRNRYVVIYNEPNHKSEWGGFVYPEEYARVLDRAIDIFHQKNPDFFVIMAGMDSSAPTDGDSMDEYQYFRQMNVTLPGIFRKIDGFASHAYGNPGFDSAPNSFSPVSVANYRFERRFLENLGLTNPRIFITEAGWRADLLGDNLTADYYGRAFGSIWTDDDIVALTPFVLGAFDGPFSGFSFLTSGGNWRAFAQPLLGLPRTIGKPELSESADRREISKSAPIVKDNHGKSSEFFLLLWQRLTEMIHIFLG